VTLRKQPKRKVAAQGSYRMASEALETLLAPLRDLSGPAEEQQKTRETVRHALLESARLFSAAAQAISSGRDSVAPGPVTLRTLGLDDAGRLMDELRLMDGVLSASVASVNNGTTILNVEALSVDALVGSLLRLAPPLRPGRVRVVPEGEREGGAVQIEAEFRQEAPVAQQAPPVQQEAPAAGMFLLSADAFFGARHFVSLNGHQGPPHNHSYRVEAVWESQSPDDDGVIVGFAEARGLIEQVADGYNETLLNTAPPFDALQPTTENLARQFFDRMAGHFSDLPVRLRQVRVWESPTSSAAYTRAA